MYRKVKSTNNSQTLKKFEEFIKIRSQKKNILHSQTETIDKKVTCFEQLLKLTKSGTTLINHRVNEKKEVESKSVKDIPLKKKQQFSEFQQNTELLLCKLDKMVNDVNGWQNCQNSLKQDKPVIKTIIKKQNKSNEIHTKKYKQSGSKSAKISRIKYRGNAIQNTVQSMNFQQKFNRFVPMKKCTNYFHKTYFPKNNNKEMSKTIVIRNNHQNFANLRKQIAQLESKAVLSYGLNFDIRNECQENDDEPEQQILDKQEMMRMVSQNDMRHQQENQYKKMVKEHMRQDSSVPSNLLGMVRSLTSKSRRFNNTGMCGSRYIRI